MDKGEWQVLAERFEAHRSHLPAVVFRMPGSPAEADDAVQEAWMRLSRAEPNAIENPGGRLTTVVSRVCLDDAALADVVVDPEQEAVFDD